MTAFAFASTQYANLVTAPHTAKNYAYGSAHKIYPFDCAAFAAAAPVTVGLAVLPPYATLDMLASAVAFANATATETIDIGWDAYRDADGVLVAADDDGLIEDLLMTTDAVWMGGILITGAAVAHSLPVANRKVFNNRDPVVLYATLRVAAPGADDTINGYFAVMTP